MKILTVCEGGTVRSVALARVLKEEFQHDAVPISWRWNSPDTIDMLCLWADRIIVMQPFMTRYIPEEYDRKLLICDVGPDRFNANVMHIELVQICRVFAELTKL